MVMHTTAMGRQIDMGAIRQKNQNVRAVGNMNVDAAGNTLDSNNQIIDDGSRRVNRVYNRTTQNPTAQAKAAAAAARPPATQAPVAKAPAPAPTPAPAPAAKAPAPKPAPVQQAPQPDVQVKVAPPPIIEEVEPEVSEFEYIDLSEYDIEEPVGKEVPAETTKKK